MHDYILPLFRMCYKKGSADSVGYLNLNLISHSVINLAFKDGQVEEESIGKAKKKLRML
jgi:hypothetical protein